ncbi:class I SAM-dependent methyltransferase [Microbulbifer sp. SSSA002]|uniref:class I SAM-dependent methyltransferase n=1 Tax=Microbulbifer sp. SSSA002 TaxID=3243376 RepID=UPI0040390344
MKNRHQEQWENLGTHDPYWAVLSDPSKKNRQWDKEIFFNSGKQEIHRVLANLRQQHMQPRLGTALDFGCGVGRLSRALSTHFKKVIGVDISSSMIAEARTQHREHPNIDFIHNTANDLSIIPDGSIDFIYSNIVLQHIPSKQQKRFIEEFCRVLRPSGIIVFQTPSQHDLSAISGWAHFLLGNRILNILRRVKYGKHGVMEVHILPKQWILKTLGECGISINEVERFDSSGKGFKSYRYYGTKS